MNKLTKNIRTHILVLNDGRELQITQEQYSTLKIELLDKKFSEPLVIKDADTNEMLFDGKCGAIKEFKHKQSTNPEGDLYWICTYGVRHRVIDGDCTPCPCRDKLLITDIEFLERIRELGFKIDYPRDVTDEAIRAYKRTYFINGEYIGKKAEK